MLGPLTKLRAIVGLALSQLWDRRLRSTLAVLGIALAVLLMVLLGGLSYGGVATAEDGLAWLDQDLWVSGGSLEFAPGTVGGVKNTLLDAHTVARNLEHRPDIQHAQVLAFQTVYVSTNKSDFETVIGVGSAEYTSSPAIETKTAFERGDVHYANGTYDGPMTNTTIISPETAAQLNVSVGDTIYIGGTITSARQHAFTVIAITGHSNYLGAPTVTVHLSELQTLTGTAASDRASMISLKLAPDADPSAVATEIEAANPALEVRTNREQIRAVFQRQGTVLASAVTLVVLALLLGTALAANVLGVLVYQQRDALAALQATGVSASTLVSVVTVQGLLLSLLGGLLALALTPAAVTLLNRLVWNLSGFRNLIDTPLFIPLIGVGLAIGMGVVGAAVAGWRVARLTPLAHLDN